MDKQSLGQKGEKIASDFLLMNNYQIIDRNFRTKFGEIDIIASDHDVLVFAEVKSRTSTSFGEPYEAVNRAKLRQIAKAGDVYRMQNKASSPKIRIDVISVLLSPGGEVLNVEILKDVS